MERKPGDKLGPYELVAPIGAGGMGEVWKARDTRLNREVAIKFSQARFSDRFQREANAIASLNHNNICALCDVGPNYLVMELIEGPTLAEQTQRPIRAALLAPARESHSTFAIVAVIAAGRAQNQVRHLTD